MKRTFIRLFIFLLSCVMLHAQEAVKSVEEEYYDFLALRGIVERPTLNYRTLSDSMWTIDDNASHPWQGQNLGIWRNLFGSFRMRIYGPELFMSGNTAAPYGQNDGVLWQGRGFNALFKGGVRFEGYGIELTLLPHLAFSQNVPFDIMPSNYDSEYGYIWGYAHNIGVDAPQRFGDKPFFDWDFGDSEIRYTWKTLTVGFGTQAIWLGPSYLNSMFHSNNAPAYPKFDIGLRRQGVVIPWINWYLGDVEARLWLGQLAESDYFDSDDSNDYTMFHGFVFAYAPSFLPGLTLFLNWIDLLPWKWEYLRYILPFDTSNTVEDDMKASFGFSWLFPQVGFEVYGELGIDDYAPDKDYIKYPLRTLLYTVGFKKVIPVAPSSNVYGELFFEWNSLEMSQDFQVQWPYSPYFHHLAIHGYTNRGQWLGAGSGYGGNSQYLGFKLFYPKGTSSLFVHRSNPDNNFLYSMAVNEPANLELSRTFFRSIKAVLAVGVDTVFYFTNTFSLGGGFVHNYIINPYYYFYKADIHENEFMHNVSLNL
ncbi:MAG: capsule assembly Wzi family protein, partial [Treponema sp.]|nr:capsule assembly Wzi family protein [Treponema sp.]